MSVLEDCDNPRALRAQGRRWPHGRHRKGNHSCTAVRQVMGVQGAAERAAGKADEFRSGTGCFHSKDIKGKTGGNEMSQEEVARRIDANLLNIDYAMFDSIPKYPLKIYHDIF